MVLAVGLVAGCAAAPAVNPSAGDGCGPPLDGFTRGVVPTAAPGAIGLFAVVGGPVDAPPVVLLHGFPETWSTWRAVAADLAVDHRVVVPDLRGVGCSPFAPAGSDAYDKRSLAADLTALSASSRLAPATVVGHDLGAMTAFAWARARPDQVAHLVLSGGGVPGFGLAELGPPHLERFAGPPAGPVRELAEGPGGLRGGLGRFVRDPAVEASGSLDAAVAAYARPGRLEAALGQYRALGRDAADNRADPRPLPMPVTTVEGGTPGISAATVRPLAPDPRVVVVPGAGHYVQEDRPGEVAAAIRAAGRS